MIRTSLTLLAVLIAWSAFAATAATRAKPPEPVAETTSVSECHVYRYTRDNVFLRPQSRRAATHCRFTEQPRRPV